MMNVSRVVFGWIVAQVFLTGLIIKLEVLLYFTVQELEISHFHRTGVLSFDSVIDNANSSSVADVDGCWRLSMPKFVKS